MAKHKNKTAASKSSGNSEKRNMQNPGSNGTKPKSIVADGNGLKESALRVQKTYKLYIGGKFPRTESGRFYKLNNKKGELIANICQGSRKDFRAAVVAARGAQSAWDSRSAYNRGQIIYRIAEIMEARKAQFVEELVLMGAKPQNAESEVAASIDRIVYYAGWSDKYQQVFSSVNPVASSHFNFSVLEPTGVVAIYAPENTGLIGLISAIMPVIVGGNTCIVLASKEYPISAISLAEVLHTSDVPGGVINILTGDRTELLTHFSTHKDVNAMVYCGDHKKDIATIQSNSTENLKRIIIYQDEDWMNPGAQGPYRISDVQEVKTTWHPVN
jgi:acyl-CoA reductase-like NAD-dependent aldehyde dehydrogenase